MSGIQTSPPGNVRTDQPDIYLAASTQDFRLCTNGLYLPAAAGFTPAVQGELGFDTTQRTARSYDGFLTGRVPRVISYQRSTTDSLDAGTVGLTTETAFATTFSIPANYLIAGKLLRLTYHIAFTVVSPNVGHTFKLHWNLIGGTLIWQPVGAITTAGTGYSMDSSISFLIAGTAAPGASVPIEVSMLAGEINAAAPGNGVLVNPINVATNATAVLTATDTFTAAATAGAKLAIRELLVEELN